MTLGSLLSGVRLALDTIRAHKMRSFLTVLGVIIGTGAMIGVGSIIAGPGWRDHRTAAQLRAEHGDRHQDGRDGQCHPRGAPPQAAHAGECASHRRTLPVGGARQPVPVSAGRPAQREATRATIFTTFRWAAPRRGTPPAAPR